MWDTPPGKGYELSGAEPSPAGAPNKEEPHKYQHGYHLRSFGFLL